MDVVVCAVGILILKVHLDQSGADVKGDYIIWDTKTGIYDGAYVNADMALDRYFQMARDNKDGKWLLVQVVHPEKGALLADEKFHARQEEIKQ
jgi:hypothetical protein